MAEVDPRPYLQRVLSSVAKKMLADFEVSGQVQHRPSKGDVRESTLVTSYLDKYLPRTVVSYHRGEIIAVNGQRSRQCDVIVADRSTPPLWDENDFRVVPVECVYTVIEVKSFLDATELRKSWNAMVEVKAMPKTAYHADLLKRSRQAHGTSWPFIPTGGLVFAYDGASIESLGETLVELAKDAPAHQRIDSVWVLSKGYLVWNNPVTGMIDILPEEDSGLAVATATPEQVLMAMTGTLNSILSTAWMPPFRITDYMSETSWGTYAALWTPDQPESNDADAVSVARPREILPSEA